MIKRERERNYKFAHPLATIVVEEVEVGVSERGRRTISASEISRMSRLAALEFLKRNYRMSLKDAEFTLTSRVVRGIMAVLGVNQTEFGELIGCQKSKVSKILRDEQMISKPQALLALERLALELARPGSVRKMLGDEQPEVVEVDESMVRELNNLRFSSLKRTA